MFFFFLIRKADELGINFWLRLLAVGLCLSFVLQGFYYFSVINRNLPVTIQDSIAQREAAEKEQNEAALASKIRSAIGQTKRLYTLGITVKNRDGVITLAGEVPTEIDRDLAVNVAKETPGVQAVNSEIQVLPSLRRPSENNTQLNPTVNIEDLEMEANLRETLQSVAELKTQPIQIKVHHREVTLTGSVINEQQRQHAEQALRYAPKIVSLSNQLRLSH